MSLPRGDTGTLDPVAPFTEHILAAYLEMGIQPLWEEAPGVQGIRPPETPDSEETQDSLHAMNYSTWRKGRAAAYSLKL